MWNVGTIENRRQVGAAGRAGLEMKEDPGLSESGSNWKRL